MHKATVVFVGMAILWTLMDKVVYVSRIRGACCVIVMVGGRGHSHNASKLQWTQFNVIQRLAIGESYQNSMMLRGGEGGGEKC